MISNIAVIDYGMGNLRSVQKALERVGAKAFITQNSKEISSCQRLVLPGVGAMLEAMKRLESLRLINVIKDAIKDNKPFLGICLGLQLLFNESEEGGRVKGLNIIPGRVRLLKAPKVPHIGWNQIKLKNSQNKSALFNDVPDEANMYFCHSYYVEPKDKSIVSSYTNYGIDFASSITLGNIFGVQFHPEKSQKLGLKILENFVKLK